MWSGSALAHQQVKSYLNRKSDILRNVEKVIITDGLTYWLYNTNDMSVPVAYMSLKTKRLRNAAYPEVKGIVDFIQAILPY